MLDVVTQKNLRLLDLALVDLAEASLTALRRGVNVLPVNHSFSLIEPYIDNLELYYSEQFGVSFDEGQEKSSELFARAEQSRRRIKKLHQFAEKHLEPLDIQPDFSDDDTMVYLGNLFEEISLQPLEEEFVNLYFLRGMLETAGVVALYRRQNTETGIAKNIDHSEIVEEIMSSLLSCGIADNTANENAVYGILCEECGYFLIHGDTRFPSRLARQIAQSFKENFAIDEAKIYPVLEKNSVLMCNFIQQAKDRMQQHRMSVHNLLFFGRDIKFIPHDAAEQMIYLNIIGENVKVKKDEVLTSRHLPDYLSCVSKTQDFKMVKSQMPQWEIYEKKANHFNHEQVYYELSKVNLFWLGCLYADINLMESQLMEIADTKDMDDDEDRFQLKIKENQKEKEVLAFCRDLVEATRLGEKYINGALGLDMTLNNTGLGLETLDKFSQKESLNREEIHILGEFIGTVGQNLDNGIDIIKACTIPDYDTVLSQVLHMPHGDERLSALKCLSGALEATQEQLGEELEAVLFDIDCLIGGHHAETDMMLSDFLQGSVSQYPDLQKENIDQLAQNLHRGVLAAYVIPAYQQQKTTKDQTQAAMMFWDNFDDYTPETQHYLTKLVDFYAQKVMKIQTQNIAKTPVSDELQEYLDDFQDGFVSLRYFDGLQDNVDEALMQETAISLKYRKYCTQKSMFELPKHFNLMLAAKFYGKPHGRF